jgi:DNA damage-binding protein 1
MSSLYRYCGNVGNHFLQITPKGIFLIDATALSLVDKWSPPDDLKINVASCNSPQILVGAGGGNLFYLEIEGSKIKLVGYVHITIRSNYNRRKTLEHEIACVNINSLDNSRAQLCAVGMWTEISVRLFKIPSLEQVTVQPLGGG